MDKKLQNLMIGLTVFNTLLVVGLTIANYKNFGEILFFKTKLDEATQKSDAAMKTVSSFIGQQRQHMHQGKRG